jgi:hypothetical protein
MMLDTSNQNMNNTGDTGRMSGTDTTGNR